MRGNSEHPSHGHEVFVCRITDVPLGEGREFEIDGRCIGIWNGGDRFYAAGAICPHAQGPLTGGTLRGRVVTCPMHAWMYDLATGRAVNPFGVPDLPTYSVRLDGDRVLVLLD